MEFKKLTENRNVKIWTDVPETSITEASVDVFKTFLDTVGRTSVTLKARNLVDEFRDREIYVSYDYSITAALRKPLVVFGSMVAVFVGAWAIGTLDFAFSTKKVA